jgi:hypothetical protein
LLTPHFPFILLSLPAHIALSPVIDTHHHRIWKQMQPFGKYHTLGLAIVCFFALFGIGAAWQDYQTNWFSRRLGVFLENTNHLRPQTGSLWQQIQAQMHTQQTIKFQDLPLQDVQPGLPDPVRQNQFHLTCIPDIGMPEYIEIAKIPVPDVQISDRSLDDITTSLRTYKQGLSIIDSLKFLDEQFQAQIHAQVEQIYAQMGNINTLSLPDTLLGAEGDSVVLIDPDSVKAAVCAELAKQILPDLKQKAKAALLYHYNTDPISQLVLYRDLAGYRGELYRQNDNTPLSFELDTEAVLRILNIRTEP